MPRKRTQVKVTVNLGMPDPKGIAMLVEFVAVKLVADILNKRTIEDLAENTGRRTESEEGVAAHV